MPGAIAPMSLRPRQRAEPSVAQRKASRCVTAAGRAIVQPVDHERVAHALHQVRTVVGGRAVDAEPDRRARRLQLARLAEAGGEHGVGGRAMADAHAVPAQRLAFLAGEMDAVRQPGARAEPAHLLQQLAGAGSHRPPGRRRPRPSSRRDGCAAGSRSARPARRSRASGAWSRRRASRAPAPPASSIRPSGRDSATARARCRRGSRPRPAPRCRAAGRHPSATGSSSRASRSCACRARGPPRPRCRRRPPARSGKR